MKTLFVTTISLLIFVFGSCSTSIDENKIDPKKEINRLGNEISNELKSVADNEKKYDNYMFDLEQLGLKLKFTKLLDDPERTRQAKEIKEEILVIMNEGQKLKSLDSLSFIRIDSLTKLQDQLR